MAKKIFIGLLALIAIGVIGNRYIFSKDKPQTKQETPAQENTEAPSTIPSNVKTYTLEEVSQHGPANPDYENLPADQSCWMVIHDKVYAIPDSFTETHPGGHVIYEGCGTDATTFFETRPQGTGTPHSEKAREMLDKFYIGDLKK